VGQPILACSRLSAFSSRNISLDVDFARMFPRLRHVLGELHPEQVAHVRPERLFDAQRHFRRQRSLAAEKVGERGPADL
jgi:hypothetical protein